MIEQYVIVVRMLKKNSPHMLYVFSSERMHICFKRTEQPAT